ncbi:MAG: camphor resistance protein CrcB [Caulobacterales bacterium 32-69-10]|nr:MAG: camphor resistance protein CrcB [Caulobacterales bacterium 32-69-10]
MMQIALVGAGGAVGAIARYLTGVGVGRMFPGSPPWTGTFVINVVGGLLMGLLIGTLALRMSEGGERWRLLLGVGVLGGFTTFSTFALEAAGMLQRRDDTSLIVYVVGSVLLSIFALMLGLFIARKVFA